MKREFAAYPLFVKDPYFSLWANTETVNESAPVFWVGNRKILNGYVRAEGKKYFFLGEGNGLLTQTHIKTEAFVTECGFTSPLFDLTVWFFSPLFPDDLEVLSCPVCYLRYEIAPKREMKDVSVCFEAEERLCYDTAGDDERMEDTTGTLIKFKDFECASFGLKRQMPLSVGCDEHGADSGYWYLSGKKCSVETREGRLYACAENGGELRGFFMLGYDDVISVNYFGRPLTGYYFRGGKNICDALTESYEREEELFGRAERYYADYVKEWERFGEDYVLMCNAALVQTIGAHKLVQDYLTGEMLFLSCECGSGACMATPDVSYPSAPLFLKYNPELVRGMLRSIFEFARKKVWVYPFAPHDVGLYPLANGQFYALKYEGEYAKNFSTRKSEKFTMNRVFLFPENSDDYDYTKQMPVEECSNMLILTYAAYCMDGDGALMKKEFDLLRKWADYLSENGNAFSDQLTSDDFCGRKSNNVNLAIKAAIGLRSFAEICECLQKDGGEYRTKAERIAEKITAFGSSYSHLPSSFDLGEETYSLKYNLVFDLFFRFHLFPDEIYRKEANCYRLHLEKYGVRLYSDVNCTKSDWLVFIACLINDEIYREEIFTAITRYMQETEHRVPFPDWYDVNDPRKDEESLFRNRSVQGGIFMPLLMKY